jgi:amino acid transporter
MNAANPQENSPRRSTGQQALMGLGILVLVTSAGFGLVFGMLRTFAQNARWTAIVAALAGVFIGLIMILIARSRERGSSTVVPAAVSLGCAFLLTGGSVVGYLATCHWEGRQDPANEMFAWLVLIGAGAFVLALLWLVVSAIVAFFRSRRTDEKSTSQGELPR